MEEQRLFLRPIEDDDLGKYALYTEEGKLLPGQYKVELVSEPGEIPVVIVGMYIDHDKVRVEGSDVLRESTEHGG